MAKKKEAETKTETVGTATAVAEEPVITETPIPERLAKEYDEILEGEKKEEPEVEPEPKEVPTEPEEGYEDIPDYLVEAGRAHGFPDAKIIQLAEEHPEVLEALAQDYQRLQSAAAVKEPEKPAEKPAETGELKPIQVDTSRFDDETSQVVKTLVDEVNKDRGIINKLFESVSGVSRKLSEEETKRQADFDLRIDNAFDSAKDVPQFGKKDSLTAAQQRARSACYGVAFALMQNYGGSIEENIQKTIKSIYGSGESSSAALRAKLNKQKTKFTARPGGQKTQPTYKTEDEKGFATMDQKGKELGIW